MATKTPGVWGIDLGQCALKAVRLEAADGSVKATAFDYIEHPKILSQPDADPDQLIREALEQFLSRNDLRGDTVCISVPGQSGLARFVKLPPVEEKKIPDIVKFEAKQQIPFPLEEVVWDFQRIGAGQVTDGYALETEIGLFAMKRDMINRYLQHFKEVNVEVHIVQMAPLALCNFVSYDLLGKGQGEAAAEQKEEEEEDEDAAGKKKCVVALDIGADSSNLVITDGEKIIWQRPIPLGGNHFTRALTKDLKLTFAKAEHVKRNAIKSPDLRKILTALKPVLNDFVSEVQRSLGYFTNTHRDAHVKYMVGLGNAFRLPGLQKYLQEKLQLEVKKLGRLERLTGEEVTGAPQFNENVLSFAVAYGLALQGLKLPRIQTNLLPQEIRVERLVRAKKPWAVAAAAGLLLALGFLGLGMAVRAATVYDPAIEKAKKDAEAVQKRIQSLKSQYEEQAQAVARSKAAVNEIASGVDERFNWNMVYKYVNDCLPQPDGSRLAELTRANATPKDEYFNAKDTGQKAYAFLINRQAQDGKAPAGKGKRDDEKKIEELIKKHLVQINVEGVTALYSDDLSTFYKALRDEENQEFFGLTKAEKELITKEPEKLPKKGWVFEVRGSTYHDRTEDFILNTFVENLVRPEAKGVDIKLSPEMKKRVKDRIKLPFLYKSQKVTSPDPGPLVQTSSLPPLLATGGGGTGSTPPGGGVGPVGAPKPVGGTPAPVGGGREGGSAPPPGLKGGGGDGQQQDSAPSGPDRSGWVPLGEIAAAAFGSARGNTGTNMTGKMPPTGKVGSVPKVGPTRPETPTTTGGRDQLPRTEFVVMFIWQEPITGEPPPGSEQTEEQKQ